MKRTPLRRRTPLKSNPAQQIEWQRRSRTALARVSQRRRQQLSERQRVREIVWARAGGLCEYANVIHEVPCGYLPGRGMEVDELRGGARRSEEWLDPERCVLTCPVHHDYKTSHKRDVLRRLGEHL